MSDWRSKLDAAESAYDEIFPTLNEITSGSGSVGPGMFTETLNSNPAFQDIESSENKSYNKPRVPFPPLPRYTLLPKVNINDYSLKDSKFQGSGVSRRTSIVTADTIAAVNFLEVSFRLLLDRVTKARDDAVSLGETLYSVKTPINEKDLRFFRESNNSLESMRDASIALIADLDVFQFTKIREVFESEEKSSLRSEFGQRRMEIVEVCQKLRDQASMTSVLLDHLVEVSQELLMMPVGESMPLDGFMTNWDQVGGLWRNVESTERSQRYAAHMLTRNMPVCNQIFRYLQGSANYCHTMDLSGYKFQKSEFSETWHFLMKSGYLSSLRMLVLDDCNLDDQSIHILTRSFQKLPRLSWLSLKRNVFSVAGVTSLSLSLWESDSTISQLFLDGNNLGAAECRLLSQAIPKMTKLQRLSVNDNPITDLGLYWILRALSNRYRKSFYNLKKVICANSTAEGSDDHSTAAGDEDDGTLEKTADMDSDMDTTEYRKTRRDSKSVVSFNMDKDYDNELYNDLYTIFSQTTSRNKTAKNRNSIPLLPLFRTNNVFTRNKERMLVMNMMSDDILDSTNFNNNDINGDTKAFTNDTLKQSALNLGFDSDVDDVDEDKSFITISELPDDNYSDYEEDYDTDYDQDDKSFTTLTTKQSEARPDSEHEMSQISELTPKRKRKPKPSKFRTVFLRIQYKLFAAITFLQIWKRTTTQRMRSLSLKNCQLTCVSFRLLSAALCDYQSTIQQLALDENQNILNDTIESNSNQNLSASMSSTGGLNRSAVTLKSISAVVVTETYQMSTDMFQLLKRALTAPTSSLRNLSLRKCNLSDETVQKISQLLLLEQDKGNIKCNLESIDISENVVLTTAANWVANATRNFFINSIDFE